MVEVMKIMATSFKRIPCMYCYTHCPQPSSRPHWPMPLLETPGYSQASLGQSLVGSLLLSPGSWCTQGSVWALQESIFQALCKVWQLFGGVNGDLLQEDLLCTQVCCTQSPCPCGSPLLSPLPGGYCLFVTVHSSPTAQRVPAISSLWVFFLAATVRPPWAITFTDVSCQDLINILKS